MPKVQKQTPLGKAPPGSDVLSRIKVVGPKTSGIKMVVYGGPKTGKTRLLSTCTKPLLIIGSEDGTASISRTKGIDFVKLQHTGELGDILELLKTGKYKSVGLDHASGLQDLCLKEILGLEDVPISRSWGMAERSDWQTLGVQIKERLRGLLNLSDTHGMNVVIIAHERNFNEEASDSELLTPTIGAALSPSIAGWLNGAVDYICQTHIRQEMSKEVVHLVEGDEGTEMSSPTGKKIYCLRVGPDTSYITGFRLPEGSVLPDFIVDPSFTKIMKLIRGEEVT